MHQTTKRSRARLDKLFDGSPVTGDDRTWALHISGATQQSIAQSLGVDKSSVSQVIHDLSTSERIAEEISRKTGVALGRLWPCGKYTKIPIQNDSKPIQKSRKRNIRT